MGGEMSWDDVGAKSVQASAPQPKSAGGGMSWDDVGSTSASQAGRVQINDDFAQQFPGLGPLDIRFDPAKPNMVQPTVKDVTRNLADLQHDIQAIGGGIGARIAAMQPAYIPADQAKKYDYAKSIPPVNPLHGITPDNAQKMTEVAQQGGWEPGRGPFHPEDLPAAAGIAASIGKAGLDAWRKTPYVLGMTGTPEEQYAVRKSVGQNMAAYPANVALNVTPSVGVLSKATRNLQGVGMAATGLQAGAQALGLNRLFRNLRAGLTPSAYADQFVDRLVQMLPASDQARMLRLERSILKAYNKIDPDNRALLQAATDRTGENLGHVLQDPKVRNYLNLVAQYEDPLWRRLSAIGAVTPDDYMVSRIWPEVVARYQRGEIALPQAANPHNNLPAANLSAEAGYDANYQQFMRSYVRQQRRLDPDFFFGRYNPRLLDKIVANYFRNTNRFGNTRGYTPAMARDTVTAQRSAIAERQAATVEPQMINGVPVQTIHGPRFSQNAALNIIYKIHATEQFLHIFNWLEQSISYVTGARQLGGGAPMPLRFRQAAAQRLSQRLAPILAQSGVDAQRMAQFQALAQQAYNNAAVPGLPNRILTGTVTLDDINELAHAITNNTIYQKLYANSASFARGAAVVANVFKPVWEFAQAAVILGHTGLAGGPRSIVNMFISASIVGQNLIGRGAGRRAAQRVVREIPEIFLEPPLGQQSPPNTWVYSPNTLQRRLGQAGRFFSDILFQWSQANNIGSGAVRKTAVLSMMLREWESLPPAAQALVAEQMDLQNYMIETYKKLSRMNRAAMGGIATPGGQTVGLLGRGLEAWAEWTREMQMRFDDLYGRYAMQPTGVQQLLNDTYIWWKPAGHGLTFALRAMTEHPVTTPLFNLFAQRAGEIHKNAAENRDLKPWALESGMWNAERLAPDGSIIVGADKGLLIMSSAVQVANMMLHGSIAASRYVTGIKEEDEKKEPTDKDDADYMRQQLNPLLGASLTFNGMMPTGSRAIANPYFYKPGDQNQYDKPAGFDLNQISAGLDSGTLPSTYDAFNEAYWKEVPFTTVTDQLILSGLYGYVPAELGISQRIMGAAGGYRPSDLTSPLTGANPRVDIRRARLMGATPQYPSQFVMGQYITPVILSKRTEMDSAPDRAIKKKRITDEKKAIERGARMSAIRKDASGKLLPLPKRKS